MPSTQIKNLNLRFSLSKSTLFFIKNSYVPYTIIHIFKLFKGVIPFVLILKPIFLLPPQQQQQQQLRFPLKKVWITFICEFVF